jgi:hypothetical protein
MEGEQVTVGGGRRVGGKAAEENGDWWCLVGDREYRGAISIALLQPVVSLIFRPRASRGCRGVWRAGGGWA